MAMTPAQVTQAAIALDLYMSRTRCVCTIKGERGVRAGVTFDAIVETFVHIADGAQFTLYVLSKFEALETLAQQIADQQIEPYAGIEFEVSKENAVVRSLSGDHVVVPTRREIVVKVNAWQASIALAPKTA